jgi:glucans biosynthesis protein
MGEPGSSALSPSISASRGSGSTTLWNDPRISDELIAFLGASYFRVLGRGQKYGISARGLAVNVGARDPEEFPFFREFWIDLAATGSERITVYALLDSASVTGAYRFEIFPSAETVVSVSATLYPRRQIATLGFAPLTSMFFTGENERRTGDDFRPELHDSDGLLMHSGSGEWIWRPSAQPGGQERVGAFMDNNPRGFGLMQRDRVFENFQDLEAEYHLRPSYWVEPHRHGVRAGSKLLELPTAAEVHDNIVGDVDAAPALRGRPGRVVRLSPPGHHEQRRAPPGGKVVNTFQVPARASGSVEPADRGLAPLPCRFSRAATCLITCPIRA